jgi:thiol:disulfide interchange protein DsbD
MHLQKRLMAAILLLPLLMVSLQAAAVTADDLPRPDEVFLISGMADGPEAIRVHWEIADGYYMYQTKFRFASDTLGVDLGYPEFPEAQIKKDEFFGDVAVYRNDVDIRIPVKRSEGSAETLTLKATSQGCADIGICYPPLTRTVLIDLGPLPGASEESAPQQPETDDETQAVEQPSRSEALAKLSDMGSALGLGAGDDDILPVEQAYRFNATAENGTALHLNWQIAEGTYLYRDEIEVKLLDGKGVALGPIELPPPEIKKDTIRPDGSIGDVALYHDEIDLTVPLLRSDPAATEITVEVGYQGCAERGICYPPVKKKLNFALPAIGADEISAPPGDAPATGDTATTAAQPVSETDQITATLASGNTWIIIATFLGFGLLLAFTPCVFPMIPILSGIIAGQGEDITAKKAFLLSVVYVLAMALTYTAAGVLAGMFGQNLQVAFQNPWVLSVFAGVFVLLALSMFGFYELQLPSSWQSRISEFSNRQQGGTLVGVAIMGLLSALIVGPCVAPPLAGALIYIGQTGDAVLGGLALFSLSIGMGAPLVAIGTSAGKLLPRAGAWMDAIKAVFGVLLLAVAIVLIERIIPPSIALLLWGALMIVTSMYMGALSSLKIEASGWERLWKGLGVVLLVYGVLMIVGAAAGSKDTVQPLRGLSFAGGAGAEAGHLQFEPVKTVADLEQRVAAASAAGKPVMLDFYAEWCVACKEMERYTFSDPAVQSALAGAVLLQADVTDNDAEDQALLQGHFGLPGPPAIMFFGADGTERRGYRVVGFMDAEPFAQHVREALK